MIIKSTFVHSGWSYGKGDDQYDNECYVSQTKGETNPNNLVISVLDIGKGCYSLP
jgi:hypothetical protein